MTNPTLHWQQFSPIDRLFSVYELVDGVTIVLDVTRDEAGALFVKFHRGAAGTVLDLVTLEALLADVKLLLRDEQPI